ncbi:MAG: TRAM domain-containing protein [Verrucomicrobiaceae bacterium]
MEGQLEDSAKERRNQELLAVQDALTKEKCVKWVGTRQTILCEGLSKTNNAHLSGRTSHNKIVIFDGDAERMTGEIFDVMIEDSTGFMHYGTPVLD